MKSNHNLQELPGKGTRLARPILATNMFIGLLIAFLSLAMSVSECFALKSVQIYNPSWTKDGIIDCLYDIEVKFPEETPAVLVGRFWFAKTATVNGGVMTRVGGAQTFVPAKSTRIVGKDMWTRFMSADQYQSLLDKHAELKKLLDNGYGFVVVVCSGGKMTVSQKASHASVHQLPKEAKPTLDDLAKIIPTQSNVSYQEISQLPGIIVANLDTKDQCIEYLVCVDGFQSMLSNPSADDPTTFAKQVPNGMQSQAKMAFDSGATYFIWRDTNTPVVLKMGYMLELCLSYAVNPSKSAIPFSTSLNMQVDGMEISEAIKGCTKKDGVTEWRALMVYPYAGMEASLLKGKTAQAILTLVDQKGNTISNTVVVKVTFE